MPISLKDLAPLARRTFQLRGTEITVRAIMAAEARALSEQIQDPPPPHTPPGDTAAQRAAEMRHPWRLQAEATARMRRRAALAGIAGGILNERGEEWTRDRDCAWANAYADYLVEHLTEAEITAIYQLQQVIECSAFEELRRVIGTATDAGN